MPIYEVSLDVVMRPELQSRTYVLEAASVEEAERTAMDMAHKNDEDIDYVNSAYATLLAEGQVDAS